MNDDYPWYRSLGPARRPSGHPDYSPITDHLYVGEYPTPDDVDWLRDELGVTAVVNVQDELDLAAKFLRLSDLRSGYARAGILFHHVPLPDGDADKLLAGLPHLIDLIGTSITGGGRVYLHCNAGMNRAPTVAIAYLHESGGMSLLEACQLVKKRRSCLPYLKALELYYR